MEEGQTISYEWTVNWPNHVTIGSHEGNREQLEFEIWPLPGSVQLCLCFSKLVGFVLSLCLQSDTFHMRDIMAMDSSHHQRGTDTFSQVPNTEFGGCALLEVCQVLISEPLSSGPGNTSYKLSVFFLKRHHKLVVCSLVTTDLGYILGISRPHCNVISHSMCVCVCLKILMMCVSIRF